MLGDGFFVLSKVFWLLARPDSVIVALLGLACVALVVGRVRLGSGLVGAVVLSLFAVGLWPVQSLLLRPLEVRFVAAPALQDVRGIVLIGGSEDLAATAGSGRPQVNQGGDRYLATLSLARRFPEAAVIFAGGGAQLRTDGIESRIARSLLTDGGITPDRLMVEGRSRNTHENAVLSRRLAPEPLAGTWVLVTSAAHMPRALGTFCAAGWAGLRAYPVDHRAGPMQIGWNPAGNLYELHAAMREWVGLLAYWITGRTDALLPEGCA